MKRYETFIIVDPDVSDEDRNQFLERLKEVISDQQGILVLVDEWGSRKLAYEIKKKSRGYYVRLDYCGTGALVDELERLFRIDDRIIKYMTVLLSDRVDMEQIQEEIAEAEAKAAKAAQAAAQKEAPVAPDVPETKTEEKPEQKPVAPDAPETVTEEKPEQEPVAPDTPETVTEEKPKQEPIAPDAPETVTEVPAETQPETKTEESE
ncbi:MAG: 30S ribosomal protein S6 [Deltaproteobacteria bacterium]|nr:30S ribosomal protein S6 [Deltaproteobacteria bacterium]